MQEPGQEIEACDVALWCVGYPKGVLGAFCDNFDVHDQFFVYFVC